ncbi:MAG: aminoacyl-tRNA hydrolase [Microgenomates group bacterium]
MKVLIGLGNPGFQYQKNRHNAGHMFIDFLKQVNQAHNYSSSASAKAEYVWITIKGEKCELLKSLSFMNTSGTVVKQVLKKHPEITTSQLYVVHDDLDIPFGKFKIQFGTGPKLHNGILSIEEELGTNEFWRIRIGVDNRGENKVDGETYSLEDFTEEEHKQLQSVFENVYKQLTQ